MSSPAPLGPGEARTGPGQKRIRGHLVKEQVAWTGLVPLASTGLLFTFGIVWAGRALQGVPLMTAKLTTAGVVIIVVIMILNAIDPILGGSMAFLIMIASLLVYGPDILNYIGFNVAPGDY